MATGINMDTLPELNELERGVMSTHTQWEYQWSAHDLANINRNIEYFQEMVKVAKKIKKHGPADCVIPTPPKVTLKKIISKPKPKQVNYRICKIINELEESVIYGPINEINNLECVAQEPKDVLLHCNTLFVHIGTMQKFILYRYYHLGKCLEMLRSKFEKAQNFKEYLDEHAVYGLKNVDNVNFYINFYLFTDHYPRFLRCGVTITHFKEIFSELKMEMGDLSNEEKNKWKSTDYIL